MMTVLAVLGVIALIGWVCSRPLGPTRYDNGIYVHGDPAETDRRLTEARRH